MGLRLRLRRRGRHRRFPYQARVILQAMRTHGLVVADNGSSGFIGGVPDERWDNDALHQLRRVILADFEAVDTPRCGSPRLRRRPRCLPPHPPPPPPAARADASAGGGALLPRPSPSSLGLTAAALAARALRRSRRPPHPPGR